MNRSESTEINLARRRILLTVQATMIRRRRRRAAARFCAAGAGLAVVLSVWWAIPASPHAPSSPPSAAVNSGNDRSPMLTQSPDSDAGASDRPSSDEIHRFASMIVLDPRSTNGEPGSSAGLSAVREISDVELLALLAATGKEFGLMQIDGRTIAVCNTCRGEEEWLGRIEADTPR